MRVLYFGIYNPAYPRNRVLLKGLRQNGVEVRECSVRNFGILNRVVLVAKYLLQKETFDVMIVGFPGQTIVPLARKLTKKPIIFDAFLSLYDSEVFDRKLHAPESQAALRLYRHDETACALADCILVDTKAHFEYFVKTFKIPSEKFRQIFVGTDEEIFFPAPKQSEKFIVHFHGKYIPLQGVEYIIGAAKKLQTYPLSFRLLGRGQEFEEMVTLIQKEELQNIELVGMVPYEKLPGYVNDSDICLGIFGTTPKASRVIPNKVVEYLACGKAVITSDTPAARELLTDGLNVRFCKQADCEDLASKILELYKNPKMRQNLGKNAHELYLENLTPLILGKKLKDIIYELV